ncbi:hypothetical protein JST97_26145 [bacterium]|nr:hypothetical protein [bacterium]
MKLTGINLFQPTLSPPVRRVQPQSVQAQDRLELAFPSSESAAACPQKPKFSLKSLPLQRLGVIGLAGLCLFGSLVAQLSANDAPAVKESAPIQQVVPRTAELGVDGWIIGHSGLKNVANPAVLPDKPPAQAEPFKLSKPVAKKHDYIKHHVNFSQLITNKEFTDSTALDSAGIQAFLEERNSFLADYSENGKSAAQIIHEAAQKANINPLVVLTTLEKENSMVSREKQPRQKALAASMGYGYTDGGNYTAGAKSFSSQVLKGAQLLADLYSEAQSQTYPLTFRADYGKHKVQIDNAATYALFQYTPHTVDTGLRKVGGGNYLFRHILEDFATPLPK